MKCRNTSLKKRTMLSERNVVFFSYILVMITLILLISACHKGGGKTNEEHEITIPVYTKTLHKQDFNDRLEVSAKVEPEQIAMIAAESSGQVLTAPFEENEPIKKGALLVRIESSVASKQVALSRASYAQAEREYKRTKQLAAEGLASPQQLDQLRSQVDQASLAMQQANIGLTKSVLRAPISGFVVNKMVRKGEFIAAGHPVARIIDYDTVKVIASVPESDIRYVKEGEEVDVEIPALKKTFLGKIYRRSIMANEASRTFSVDIRIPNENHEILPGMRAKVYINRESYKNIIIVDQSSILQGVSNQEAMVFDGNSKIGHAERRIVKTGPTQGATVVVLSGLNDGDRLITRGHRGIIDGTLIEDHTNDKLEDTGNTIPATDSLSNNDTQPTTNSDSADTPAITNEAVHTETSTK